MGKDFIWRSGGVAPQLPPFVAPAPSQRTRRSGAPTVFLISSIQGLGHPPMRIPCENISRTISFFDESRAVIEVIRGAEGAGLLDASSEGIVLKGRRSAVGTRNNGLGQPVLEVPGEAPALGVGEGIAVCVVGHPSARHQTAPSQRSFTASVESTNPHRRPP